MRSRAFGLGRPAAAFGSFRGVVDPADKPSATDPTCQREERLVRAAPPPSSEATLQLTSCTFSCNRDFNSPFFRGARKHSRTRSTSSRKNAYIRFWTKHHSLSPMDGTSPLYASYSALNPTGARWRTAPTRSSFRYWSLWCIFHQYGRASSRSS